MLKPWNRNCIIILKYRKHKVKRYLIAFILLLLGNYIIAQKDSIDHKKIEFTGDFRFRIEHDWNGLKSNGSLIEDRSRLRYRFRFGINYSIDKHSSFGGRIRTGNINDQQGPHLTIGGNEGEFGLAQIGFEKLFYQYKHSKFTGWIGKNTIPIKKLNELFWNDNTYPEGIGLKYNFLDKGSSNLKQISLHLGHFIIKSNNQTFNKDSYLQIAQFDFNLFQDKIHFFPGFYIFNRIGNFPDGKHTFLMNYKIIHLGSEFRIIKQPNFRIGIEFYNNLEDYSNQKEVPSILKNEKTGFVFSAKYGTLKDKGNWQIALYYAHIQKYAIVDYFAQNDWVRWDYSSVGATGSRISNFQGFELNIGYALKNKFNLILRSYLLEQLINTGEYKENGNRIRLDLNIGF